MPISGGIAAAAGTVYARVARANHILAANLGRLGDPRLACTRAAGVLSLPRGDRHRGHRRGGTGQWRVRPGRPPECLQPAVGTDGRARRSPSSTPTTTRAPRPTSAVYRAQFGLPRARPRTAASRKVNQTGGTTYPAANDGWAEEISLDLDMVSAVCPNCHILLVEAKRPIVRNLGAAVNKAAALGANEISNSYGGPEASFERDDAFLQPSGHRHHRQVGRQRVRRRVPGGVALRDIGRRDLAAAGRQCTWLE